MEPVAVADSCCCAAEAQLRTQLGVDPAGFALTIEGTTQVVANRLTC